jgi:hypothetical protein
VHCAWIHPYARGNARANANAHANAQSREKITRSLSKVLAKTLMDALMRAVGVMMVTMSQMSHKTSLWECWENAGKINAGKNKSAAWIPAEYYLNTVCRSTRKRKNRTKKCEKKCESKCEKSWNRAKIHSSRKSYNPA